MAAHLNRRVDVKGRNDMKEEKITFDITEEKTNEITKALTGLNVFQWNQIKSAVDTYFSSRLHDTKREIRLEESETLNRFFSDMPSFTPRQSE